MVSRHDIAGIWVAFFSRCQRYRCWQVKARFPGLLTMTAGFGWRALLWPDIGLLAVCGVFQFIGQYFFIDAFRYASVSMLAPFRYAMLVWALIAGCVIWGDVPDLWAIAGMLLIVGSGLFVIYCDPEPRAPRVRSSVRS